MHASHSLWPLFGALAFLFSAQAGAQSGPSTVQSPESMFAKPVDTGTLEQMRGGTAVHNDMDLNGVTAGNTAMRVNTGNNIIDAGSFANMSGLPVVIQNSGANVLIQNATIVNLQMR